MLFCPLCWETENLFWHSCPGKSLLTQNFAHFSSHVFYLEASLLSIQCYQKPVRLPFKFSVKIPLFCKVQNLQRSRCVVFLGPRGPHGIPLSVRPLVCPSARKKWITYIQACMPHESSEDSSNQPDGPMGSPKCSPWPPGTPRPPPSTLNDSKTGLLSSLNSSDHLACF